MGSSFGNAIGFVVIDKWEERSDKARKTNEPNDATYTDCYVYVPFWQAERMAELDSEVWSSIDKYNLDSMSSVESSRGYADLHGLYPRFSKIVNDARVP